MRGPLNRGHLKSPMNNTRDCETKTSAHAPCVDAARRAHKRGFICFGCTHPFARAAALLSYANCDTPQRACRLGCVVIARDKEQRVRDVDEQASRANMELRRVRKSRQRLDWRRGQPNGREERPEARSEKRDAGAGTALRRVRRCGGFVQGGAAAAEGAAPVVAERRLPPQGAACCRVGLGTGRGPRAS